ncbi:hypothetical protein PHMEG_00016423 [Phytophthora megakarya]|uniref:Eukaryotic/viral aspartic protease n=1 Tax=Phytophthora megakarya TaxID=4795 RepID=A0A225W0F6_9STRA|nr:hypothetical protein PHMEG_00016423 [Phytophthora megakarya]
MVQSDRISAISDLKAFTGKDQDEDRARAWISKVKSAFMGDEASDDEKCLTFADLLAGSGKNWYCQLSRSTRNKWSDLLCSFQIQYGGLGVSVARQYYHTGRRSDESPLGYLYRLNVAGLRARLKIKDVCAEDRREHVYHYIETLEDQALAERSPSRSGSSKESSAESFVLIWQVSPEDSQYSPSAPAKQVRAIQIQANDSGSDSESVVKWIPRNYGRKLIGSSEVTGVLGSEVPTVNPDLRSRCPGHSGKPDTASSQILLIPLHHKSDGSGGSDSDIDSHRRIFLAANGDVTPKVEKKSANRDPRLLDRDHGHQDHNSKIQGNGFNRDLCSHCGSKKHSDLGCWRLVTCTKCDKRRHLSDHCLFVCRGCGELLDMGKCPMEEFYNQICQRFNPTKHMGMLPEAAEKMLN